MYQVIKGDEVITRYFHSDTLFITSKNIIKGYMDDTYTNFLNHLEQCKNNSDTVFDKFIEIQISTSRNKAIAGKSYIELPWFRVEFLIHQSIGASKICRWLRAIYVYFELYLLQSE
jgi:hypothetical protein